MTTKNNFGRIGMVFGIAVCFFGLTSSMFAQASTPVFTRDLVVGSVGSDVLVLQRYLNQNGFIVAQNGPGSPGNETTYFGQRTKHALTAFQTAHSTEIFGPLGSSNAMGNLLASTRVFIDTPPTPINPPPQKTEPSPQTAIPAVTENQTVATYTVGGTATGLSDIATIRDAAGVTLTLDKDGAFTFPTQLHAGDAFSVSIISESHAGRQTCSITGGTGSIIESAVTSVAVTCAPSEPVARRYSVGGTVSGLAGTGLILRDNGGNDITIAANGAFTFTSRIINNRNYSVTVASQPTSPAQLCSVASGSGTVSGANVTNVAVTCAAATYTIGGTVMGLTSSGLVLRNNGGNDLSISSNGSFTFSTPLASGIFYFVSVATQPTDDDCTVFNNVGIVGAANITNVSVVCLSQS